MKATKVGKWKGIMMQKDGTKKNIVFEKVKVVRELWDKPNEHQSGSVKRLVNW